ncbi:hypothetical protein DRQ26_00985 [bacterium]|nr:MAG: hypothetical protein DRQ26_00985 [bacterium]
MLLQEIEENIQNLQQEVIVMAFNVLFLAHAPDAEAEKHRCVIETPKYYKLFAVVVREQEEAIEICKKYVKEQGIQSILLCPGFTHKDIAEISEAVGENVGVFVARGDGPSNRASMEAMKKEGFFQKRE